MHFKSKFLRVFKNFSNVFVLFINKISSVFLFFHNFFKQNLSIVLVPHIKGETKVFKISFFTLFIILTLFLSVFLGFVWFAFNYVNLKTALVANQKIYKLAEKDIDLFRTNIEELNNVALDFTATLSQVTDSLNIKESNNLKMRDDEYFYGDFANFSNLTILDQKFSKEISDLQSLKDKIELSVNPLKNIIKVLNTQKYLLSDIPSIWPLSASQGVISAHFGPAKEPFTGQWYIHKGLDVAHKIGTPILATADGLVMRATYMERGYGNYVHLKHKYGLSTLYGHMSRINVTKGMYVKKGDVIGFLGKTGYATGPHVHYEVRVGSQVVNPDLYVNIATGVLD